MFYHKEIFLYNNGEYEDSFGITRDREYKLIKNLMVDIQPYSSAKLETEYGYKLEVTKRMFCDIDQDIIESSIIKYDVAYEIKKIIPWDDYYEIMLIESDVLLNE